MAKCQFYNSVINLSRIGQQSHEEVNTALSFFVYQKVYCIHL